MLYVGGKLLKFQRIPNSRGHWPNSDDNFDQNRVTRISNGSIKKLKYCKPMDYVIVMITEVDDIAPPAFLSNCKRIVFNRKLHDKNTFAKHYF